MQVSISVSVVSNRNSASSVVSRSESLNKKQTKRKKSVRRTRRWICLLAFTSAIFCRVAVRSCHVRQRCLYLVCFGKVRSYSALASQCHLLGVVARSCGFTSLFLFSLPLLSALTRRPLFLSCSCKARQLLFSEVPFKTPLFPSNLVLYCHYTVYVKYRWTVVVCTGINCLILIASGMRSCMLLFRKIFPSLQVPSPCTRTCTCTCICTYTVHVYSCKSVTDNIVSSAM